MIREVREDEPMLADGCRSRRSSSAQDRPEREVRMAELLISSRRTSEDDLRSLMDRLSVAIPDAEPSKTETASHRDLGKPLR
jgi:hypothetical protein